MNTCFHCGRSIVPGARHERAWVDPEAPATPEQGDDHIWRETCDANDSFTADHAPDHRNLNRQQFNPDDVSSVSFGSMTADQNRAMDDWNTMLKAPKKIRRVGR